MNKRFLLLALTAGLLSPFAAKAERIWLVLIGRSTDSMEKIEMESMEQCEKTGKQFAEYVFVKISRAPKYICLKGK